MSVMPRPHMIECFICEGVFQHGPTKYEGRGIGAWDICVCDLCYRGNWDGLVPQSQPKLMAHLAERAIAPVRNARGWIDWPE